MKKKKIILINPGISTQTYAKNSSTKYPPLGIAYIAALTAKDKWEIEILDENYEKVKYKPCDLVCFSIMTCQANRAYEIATQYKEKGVPVIFGGVHPTFCTEESLEFCDSVVVGEAENIWSVVLEDFQKGNLKKIYKSEKEVDIHNLIYPAHDLLDKRYNFASISTSRGCPMQCEFCSVASFHGNRYRTRPADEVVNEISICKKKFIFFADDNPYGYSEAHTKRFIDICKGMIKNKLNKTWITQISMNFCYDLEAVKIAGKSGLIAVLLGIESVNDEVLSGNMNKKINKKYVKNFQYSENLHKHGILICGSFILGNWEDNEKTFDNLYNFIKRSKIDVPAINFLTPFPGTPLEKRLGQENKLDKFRNFPEDWVNYNLVNQAIIETSTMSRDDLNKNMKKLIKKVYSRLEILKRALYVLYYSKSLLKCIMAFQANLGYRDMYFNSVYFKSY